MKKIVSILLMLCILFLCGCNPIPKDGYLYIEEDGYYYLTFRELPSSQQRPSREQYSLLSFSSVAEMKDAIDHLSEERIEAMRRAFAIDREKNRIYVCNFEQFYEPVFPDNVINHHTVTWMSMHYFTTFSFVFDEEELHQMGITVPGAYYELLNRHKTRFDNSEDYDYLQKEYDAERNADVYTYIDGYIYPNTDRIPRWKKQVQYTLTKGEKTVFVVEEYSSPEHTGDFEESPHFVIVLVAENGGFMTGSFEWNQEERPTEEWLLSFGIEPFVPESAADTGA